MIAVGAIRTLLRRDDMERVLAVPVRRWSAAKDHERRP